MGGKRLVLCCSVMIVSFRSNVQPISPLYCLSHALSQRVLLVNLTQHAHTPMNNSVFAAHRFTASHPTELSTSSASCRLFDDDADDDDFVVPVTPFIGSGSRSNRNRLGAVSHSSMGATTATVGDASTSSYGQHSSTDFTSQQSSTHHLLSSQGRGSGSTLEYLECCEDMMKIVIAPKPKELPNMRIVLRRNDEIARGIELLHHDNAVHEERDDEAPNVNPVCWGPATAVEDGFASEIGPRKNQEDNYVAQSDKKLWAVFDGHRGHGSSSFAASFLSDHMTFAPAPTAGGHPQSSDELCQQFARDVGHLEASMKASAVGEGDGSTACIAMIGADGALRVANVGDSRAVFASSNGTIRFVTEDHKNSCEFEAHRIAEDLRLHREAERSVAGVSRRTRAHNGGQDAQSDDLSVTRALGDFDIKQQHIGLSSMVDIYEVYAAPGDVLIIASDGVWDVVTAQEAINIVLHEIGQCSSASKASDNECAVSPNTTTPRNEPRCAAQTLVRAALDRRTGDNCTAVVIRFKW